MERKIYNKPFMVREQFLPQDFVAACDFNVNVNVLPFNKNYTRIDLNHDGKFNHEFSGSSVSYTELGYDYIDTEKHTFKPNQYEIVDVNVYKIDSTEGGTPQSQNGHPYTNSEYTLVATQMIRSQWGKYYFINVEGTSISQQKNQS